MNRNTEILLILCYTLIAFLIVSWLYYLLKKQKYSKNKLLIETKNDPLNSWINEIV